MNRKGLAVLMRTRMPLPPSPNQSPPPPPPSPSAPDEPPPSAIQLSMFQGSSNSSGDRAVGISTSPKDVKEWMKASISIPTDKTESLDATLEGFLQGYLDLSDEGRWELVLALARDYDVNRVQVRGLMEQYLGLGLPNAMGDQQLGGGEDEGALASFYRMERNLRDALKPAYAVLFERLNAYPGGLKLLVILRADLLSLLGEENLPSLRALDSYLKEKLITWLSPAALELHQITWDDSASLLEKIVAYEAVHPIRSLLDLKRRLSVGRRCFGYLHPAIPGEPLIFIEVALLKKIAKSIQEVLLDDPPTPENEATSALFYSISSTQPGLSGINLGKFLIKRVVELLRREMPYITTFATLSPIPGYMPWLLSKLASQLKLAKSEPEDMTHVPQSGSISAFREDILSPEEEIMILESAGEHNARKSGLEVMDHILTSANIEWTKSERVAAALEPPLMRLCARYLIKEKKRRKALDPVANFHLQNGAMIERINWMADQSGKGIHQSAGIMVNYVYRLEKIEEYAQLYLSTGHIHTSSNFDKYHDGAEAA